MNYSKYRFNLDMQSYISQISLPVRQNDTGISLRINLTDGGIPYTINDGCVAMFFARKSDGNPLLNYCLIENNTTICYELTQQTTACSGVVDCEIRLYGPDGSIITTPRFILVVDSRVVSGSDFVPSDGEMDVLDNILISEAERQENEIERKKTYEEMLDTVREASEFADIVTERLAAGEFSPHIGENGNWWVNEKDTGVLASPNTLPLRAKEASNSLVQLAPSLRPNKALSQSAVALGENCIAGCMGYYISEIYYGDSSNNPQVRVSSSIPLLSGLRISDSPLSAESSFTAPKYSVGSQFNITCGSHYFYIGTIQAINRDVITFTGDIQILKDGFDKSVSDNAALLSSTSFRVIIPGTDDYTLCVPSDPTVGIVSVSALGYTEGCDNISAGIMTHSEGRENISGGAYSHTEGRENLAGYCAHSEGRGTDAIGKYSHTEGKDTEALGENGHAEGQETKAKELNTHTEGYLCTATAREGHAEGFNSHAKGKYSHAQNLLTEASGDYSTSMGRKTKATNYGATSMGEETIASGQNSLAAGHWTRSKELGQAVFGKYNADNPNALLIVGRGTTDTERSNAFEVLKESGIVVGDTVLTEATITALLNLLKFSPERWSFTLDDGTVVDKMVLSKDRGTITFIVNGTTYTATEEETWEEFVTRWKNENPSAPYTMFRIDTVGARRIVKVYGIGPQSYQTLKINGNIVYAENSIVDGGVYYGEG